MADAQKDTIYIDIDDEITGIIDKVRASSSKVVALVLPKRASVLQSIVNMKLLKRAADDAKKNLVLVTTESGILPLAGAVGLHVANTPNSRPEIPAAPGIDPPQTDVDDNIDLLQDETDEPVVTRDKDGAKSVGELAGASAATTVKPTDTGIETVELDNDEPALVAPVAATGAAGVIKAAKDKAAKAKKPKKDSKLKVPDFNKFRLLLILGAVGVVALGVLGYIALVVMPKATIFISTDSSNVNTNVDFTLSSSATNLDTEDNIVPAKLAQIQKTQTGSAPATGQENNGSKATGSVTFTNCTTNNSDISIPSGTGISANGNTYITQSRVSLPYSGNRPNGNCTSQNGITAQSVNVVAQAPGTKSNTGDNTSFTVSGYGAVRAVAGNGLNGGTDDIRKVVSTSDIDTATKNVPADDAAVEEELTTQLEEQGLYAISTTYNTVTPNVSASAKAGDATDTVTVTRTTTYTMYGVREEYLRTLVDASIKDQIDADNQGILSRGIEQEGFKVVSANANGTRMNLQTTAEVGPDIDTNEIAQQAAGKKSGEIRSNIGSNPDVTNVTVEMSPFWVTKAPSNTEKITVEVAKPSRTANDDNQD